MSVDAVVAYSLRPLVFCAEEIDILCCLMTTQVHWFLVSLFPV